MENKELQEELLEMEKELQMLKDEQKILETFFIKGMDNNKYKDLMLQKKENEIWIAELEIEIQLLNNEIKNG